MAANLQYLANATGADAGNAEQLLAVGAIHIDRKMLAELAFSDAKAFAKLVEMAKA